MNCIVQKFEYEIKGHKEQILVQAKNEDRARKILKIMCLEKNLNFKYLGCVNENKTDKISSPFN